MARAVGAPQEEPLAVTARLDLEHSDAFRREAVALLEALPAGRERLLLDLSATVRLDSAGMRALLLVRRRAAALGVTVRLRGIRQEIRQLLALAKVEDLFELESAPA